MDEKCVSSAPLGMLAIDIACRSKMVAIEFDGPGTIATGLLRSLAVFLIGQDPHRGINVGGSERRPDKGGPANLHGGCCC